MALKRKYGISALLVLILGLVSCSKDKEVVYVPERVQTGVVGTLDSQKRMTPTKDIKQLELGGELTVDLLREQDFAKNPLLIKTETNCASDSFSETGSYNSYFQNTTSIPVLSILSENALLSASAQPLICSITLRISNSLSSEEIYLLKSVKITDSPQFTNLALFQETTAALLYETEKATPLPQGDIYQLKCDDFQKRLAIDQEVTWESLMNSSATDATLWRHSRQHCRVLIKKENEIFLSKPFDIFFNPQPLVIEPALHMMATAISPLTDRTVLSLRVMNPNAYSIRIKVQDLPSSTFLFRSIHAHHKYANGYAGSIQSLPLAWSYQSHLFKSEINETSWTFDLPPNQEIHVQASVKVHLDCGYARPRGVQHELRKYPVFVGLNFGFQFQTKFLTQISDESWSENPLTVGALGPLASDSMPFWDLHFLEIKSFFAPFFANASSSNEEFRNTVSFDPPLDICRPL